MVAVDRLSILSKITTMKPVLLETEISDVNNRDVTQVCVEINRSSIELHFDGYSVYNAYEKNSYPVRIEMRNGVPFVVIYSEINRQEPTHTINLAGAATNLRSGSSIDNDDDGIDNDDFDDDDFKDAFGDDDDDDDDDDI